MISALLLILEMSFLSLTVVKLAEYSYITVIVALLLSVLAFIHIINTDTNPEYKLTWIVIILMLPVFGTTLYLIFSKRRLTRSESERLSETIKELNAHSDKDASLENLEALSECDKSAAGRVISVMGDDPLAEVYRGTSSRYFALGEDMHSAMLEDIKSAKHYIFLEYFIVAEGEMWDSIYALLREKVKQGVQVKMLYDDIGCMTTLPANFDKRLRAEGIDCHRFSPLTPRLSTVHNNRDHRKILVVDGRIAYTGGVNIADEYINKKVRFGHWKDGGIRLEGDAAIGFSRIFLSSFELAAGVRCDYSYYLGINNKAKTDLCPSGDGGFYVPLCTGPAPIYKHSGGKRAIMNIINRAERYVYITTPYLIIDFDLSEALRSAAARGVDVRIVTPAIPDKKIIKIMTKSYYPALIDSGVRIFEYTPGFIHEKTVVCDDSYAMIGTINLDYRSLVHHFECAVLLYSSPEITTIRDEVYKTLSQSAEIDSKGARLGFFELIIKNLVRIFAPLL